MDRRNKREVKQERAGDVTCERPRRRGEERAREGHKQLLSLHLCNNTFWLPVDTNDIHGAHWGCFVAAGLKAGEVMVAKKVDSCLLPLHSNHTHIATHTHTNNVNNKQCLAPGMATNVTHTCMAATSSICWGLLRSHARLYSKTCESRL